MVGGNGLKWVEVGRSVASTQFLSKLEEHEHLDLKDIYNGVFRHGVDDKRRVQIPAMWRPESQPIDFTLIIWPEHKAGPCLRVLPPRKMRELILKLEGMPNSDPRKMALIRRIGTRSIRVSLDKSGRICIPENFAAEARIAKEVTFAGCLNFFEIWNPEIHQKADELDSGAAEGGFPFIP